MATAAGNGEVKRREAECKYVEAARGGRGSDLAIGGIFFLAKKAPFKVLFC